MTTHDSVRTASTAPVFPQSCKEYRSCRDASKTLLRIATPISKRLIHAHGMDGKTRETLARNVSILMTYNEHTQTALAKKAGISQRTISNICDPNSPHSPKLDSVDAVARAYRLEVWHLLIPDAPLDLLINKRIEKVVDNYVKASETGRDMIHRVSDREAEVAYQVTKAKAG